MSKEKGPNKLVEIREVLVGLFIMVVMIVVIFMLAASDVSKFKLNTEFVSVIRQGSNIALCATVGAFASVARWTLPDPNTYDQSFTLKGAIFGARYSVVGAIVGVFAFFVLKSGIFTKVIYENHQIAESLEMSPYGMVLISGLAGMFAPEILGSMKRHISKLSGKADEQTSS